MVTTIMQQMKIYKIKVFGCFHAKLLPLQKIDVNMSILNSNYKVCILLQVYIIKRFASLNAWLL